MRNHYKGAGCLLERHQVPWDCQVRNAHLQTLLSSKWAVPYLHKKLDGNTSLRFSDRALLTQNAFIRANDHHTVEDRWLGEDGGRAQS